MGASHKPAPPGQTTPSDRTQPTAMPATPDHAPKTGGDTAPHPPDGTPPTILRGSVPHAPQPRKSLFRK